MSKLSTSSPKHCANKGVNVEKLYKRGFYAFSTLLLSIFSLIFFIWLILRPSKPQFYLKETDIYQLNLSGAQLLNSSIQITVLSKNPNKKVGIYYDQLQAYASYKAQQITPASSLPPFYQGHEDNNLLTASLLGSWVPVAPSFGYEVGRDQASGKLFLGLKLNGHLRWKVGTWVSGRHRFNVDCVAVMAFGPNVGTGPLSSRQGTQCSTNV
ncbi:NDR1/HIN1-like protein 26 [Magnolia sinica]|uniref:NDR1/HIN1-like protein 26 n=1 Tax=Magnolia sinica TaxID=86752 RepID=UPI0026590D2B|nr:NDR1/HIN1-like protein 26 [Magnolia sinica]